MSFLQGIRDFFFAARLLFSHPACRRWYLSRLWKALLLGSVLLLLMMLIFAIILWQLYEFALPYISYPWLEGLLIAGGAVLFGLIGYMSAGPIALLIMGVYMSQIGRWQELSEALPQEALTLPQFEDSSSLFQSIRNAVLLSLFVFFCAVLSLIPFIAFISIFSGAFALGKDWCWTANEQYRRENRRDSSFLYCTGLGFFPALLASIPIIGVLSIPILQLAGLIRYSNSVRLKAS